MFYICALGQPTQKVPDWTNAPPGLLLRDFHFHLEAFSDITKKAQQCVFRRHFRQEISHAVAESVFIATRLCLVHSFIEVTRMHCTAACVDNEWEVR